MKNKIINLFMTFLGAVTILLSSCQNEVAPSDNSENKGEREAITICAPSRNVKDFIEVVHKKYPEIVFNVDAYAGQNGTVYMENQLLSGDAPDIYSISYYMADHYDLSDKLMDLSKYSFTGNYVSSRLADVNENGSIYLLPSYYNCLGITYNKKILKDNGWELPQSFEELEALAPKVKAKGYQFALNELALPGYGFQYFCNILDTGYLSTRPGRNWQKNFLDGKATLKGSEEMLNDIKLLERWRSIGMLNGDSNMASDVDTCDEFAKGNALFLLGNTNNVDQHGANIEDFGLMPYLSVDGKQNVYIMQVSRFMGLNKKLEEKGNEQKLQDALHVMEVLSTNEGMEALNGSLVNTNISPLKGSKLSNNNLYSEIIDDINAGFTAPFIYSGWENVIPGYGRELISFIRGERELDEVINYIDDNQHLLTEEMESFTVAEETISIENCAKIIGISFAEATDADFSIVSMGGMCMETGATNGDGVNGKLFAKKITEPDICSITPTGWNGTVKTITLTGKRAKELASTGFNRKNRGYFFEYLTIKKDSLEIGDDTTYKIAIVGYTTETGEEGNVQDSSINGLKAIETYLKKFPSINNKNIDWR